MDNSTPDRTVKSFWAYKDYLGRCSLYEITKNKAAADQFNESERRLQLNWSKLLNSPMSATFLPVSEAQKVKDDEIVRFPLDHPEKCLNREIVEVKQESESRAIVDVKVTNIRPLPSDLHLTEAEDKERNLGQRYRVVCEKESSGWKMENVQEEFDQYGGDGKTSKEWRDNYKPGGKPEFATEFVYPYGSF